MKKLNILLLLLASVMSLSARTWHVSPNGSDSNDGSAQKPLRTISHAAFHALASDTILIGGGTYREMVSPANTGLNDMRRITYMAAPGEEVWLKGSEVIANWEKESKGIWSVKIPNTFFGNYNPYKIEIFGDWLLEGYGLHLGEVYINGDPLQEYLDIEELSSNEMSWWTSVDDHYTTIRANFGDQNPTKELVEINVRPTCFFPQTTGISYITVKGLNIAQAATQWSPPTGEQVGIIGPNWSKGWIIEDCHILHSKCVGICIGKDRASGHNLNSLYKGSVDHLKTGFTREIEAIFKAYELGWSQTNVGSHLIQNNVIHDCNQAGIVGHLGCIFSTIRNNEIYNINVDTPIGGHETGGIKLHAGIDVVIENNCITNTRRGIWIDWQAQGMHVRNNVFADNISEDLFVEVSHGPTLVYNNIFLSNSALFIKAQGVAYFNNIIGGRVDGNSGARARYTPYHHPHATAIKGIHNNPGGDWHFYNNIFLAEAQGETLGKLGLEGCEVYPATMEEFRASIPDNTESALILTLHFPIRMDCNLYYGENSLPHPDEQGYTRYADKRAKTTLSKGDDGHYYLSSDLKFEDLAALRTVMVDTNLLGQAMISELLYENADQTSFTLDHDYFGRERDVQSPFIGPFEGEVDLSKPIW